MARCFGALLHGRYYEDLAKAITAKEQPRQAVNEEDRRRLPAGNPLCQLQSSLFQTLPLDCRLLIWEYILKSPRTRIERWRLYPNQIRQRYVSAEACDADCFPYRTAIAGYEKPAKALNLLLCCRRLYLEGLPVLYSTTFVFEMPLDLYSFQLCISPEGLSNVVRLIIAFGQVDARDSGYFFSNDTKDPKASLKEWENAIHGLKSMRRLQYLELWLGHRQTQIPVLERRPWKEGQASQTLEKRHQRLFDLLETVRVSSVTVHLTWNPVDVLAQRKWRFQVVLHTLDDMWCVLNNELPEKTDLDSGLYIWFDTRS